MTSRIQNVTSKLQDDQNFLITNPVNVRYLCGYTGSNGILLVTPHNAFLFTDARYELQAAKECFDVDVVICTDLYKSALDGSTASTCLFEARHMTVATLERLKATKKEIDYRASEISIEALRVVKDSSELALIGEACAISTSALQKVIDQVRVGMTEKQVAILLERTMVDSGADSIAFETIVASGPNSAIAHHQPTDRLIESGDLLKIDFGAKLAGYHSDCTRTFVVGQASDWQKEIHQAVLLAQSSSRASVKPGVVGQDIVQPTLDALNTSGHLEYFRHGLGHGVGLEIHEDPFLSKVLTTTLEAGTVITVEPGVYLPNQGGVRIEDSIVVNETGYENLTVFSYELQEIG